MASGIRSRYTLGAAGAAYEAAQAAERAARRVDGLREGRESETVRRDHLRALRKAVAEAGYAGTIRLAARGRGSVLDMSMPPEAGIRATRFEVAVGAAGLAPTRDEIIAKGLALVDLAMIAARRNAAIRSVGGDVSSPPAWAFIGHPIIRGVIAALTPDPSAFRPLDPTRWQKGVSLSASVHDMRLGHTGVRLRHRGVAITIDAGNQMARVRLNGTWPETVIDALPGMPLGDIIGLPGLERGTPAGDARIRDGWQEEKGLGFTVSCRLCPLADAPDGVDTGWLSEWEERHAI